LDHTLRGMRDVHHDAETIARTDHVRAKGREAVVNDGAGLEIADVVRRVVHELHGPDAAAVRLLEPLELELEEVEPLDVQNDGRLPGGMRGLQICDGQDAADAVPGHELVHPGNTLEV